MSPKFSQSYIRRLLSSPLALWVKRWGNPWIFYTFFKKKRKRWFNLADPSFLCMKASLLVVCIILWHEIEAACPHSRWICICLLRHAHVPIPVWVTIQKNPFTRASHLSSGDLVLLHGEHLMSESVCDTSVLNCWKRKSHMPMWIMGNRCICFPPKMCHVAGKEHLWLIWYCALRLF